LGKVALAPTTYVQVQQTLFKTYGPVVGALEALALVSTAVWLVLDHRRLSELGGVADAAMIAVWGAVDQSNQSAGESLAN
jgi:hypothetical protein